ncbi:MAG: NCS2 family permease [Gammaproteobacteria bacterium]|nr:NCS2 family permease [Gammaproteobacteria bacterium]
MILGKAGIGLNAAFTATCLTAAIGSLLIGLWSNYPIAIAPSMALNVYFTYVVVDTFGLSWQTALSAVFISGILFLILTLSSIREKLVQAIPKSLAVGVASGIGLFIGLIALQNLQIINIESSSIFTLSSVHMTPTLLTLVGLAIIMYLEHKKIPGAILLSILLITFLSLALHLASFKGIIAIPHAIKPTFSFIHIKNTFHRIGFEVIFAFFLVALFDSTGSLVGLLEQTKLKYNPNQERRLSKALMADSITTIIGAILGTSTVSPYIESASGISAGGKTGLSTIIVAIFFMFALVLSPLAKTIPSYATAPALLFVAWLMMKHVKNLNYRDLSDFIPGLITTIAIPLTFSIADGVGIGLISYMIIKLLTKKYREITPLLLISTITFVIYFITKP